LFRQLTEGRPGSRFESWYNTRKHKTGGAKRPLTIVAGVVVVMLGLFFLPAPGPGMVILAFGAALIAQQSLTAARLLDSAEVRTRRILRPLRRFWKHSPAPVRVAIALLVSLMAGAAAFSTFWLFLSSG
jgi:hypothetical protein